MDYIRKKGMWSKMKESNKIVFLILHYKIIDETIKCVESIISNYNNDEINQLITDSSNMDDTNQIKENYKRIIQIYNDEKPFMSIARKKSLLVYNTNLTGNLKPTPYNIYNYIEKWYRKNY